MASFSYNTRRSGEGVNTVGARRPITNNFVPGGQLTRPQTGQQQAQMKPTGQQQQRPQVQRPGPLSSKQAPQVKQPVQQQAPQVKQPAQQQVLKPPVLQLQPPAAQAPVPVPAPVVQQVAVQQPKVEPPSPAQQTVPDAAMSDASVVTKKPWQSGGVSKLSKRERQRRRNLRLRKILQPKNPTMVLNELVKGVTYTFTEGFQPSGEISYTALVEIEGTCYSGHGPSKADAKNNASEAAIKYIVQNPTVLREMIQDSDGDSTMDDVTDSETSALPWQHVASLALYKLLNSWGETFCNWKSANQLTNRNDNGTALKAAAKKLPDNAASMNPIMLVNQMLPAAVFEELSKVGTPPNITFNFQCTANGENFFGSGPNKKTAKKMAAYAVCTKILNIQYPPEEYSLQC